MKRYLGYSLNSPNARLFFSRLAKRVSGKRGAFSRASASLVRGTNAPTRSRSVRLTLIAHTMDLAHGGGSRFGTHRHHHQSDRPRSPSWFEKQSALMMSAAP